MEWVAESNRFSFKFALYLGSLMFPSTLASFIVSDEEKQRQSSVVPSPCVTAGAVCSERCSVI